MTRIRAPRAAAAALVALLAASLLGACGKDEPKPGVSGLPITTTTPTTAAPGVPEELGEDEAPDLLDEETTDGDEGS